MPKQLEIETPGFCFKTRHQRQKPILREHQQKLTNPPNCRSTHPHVSTPHSPDLTFVSTRLALQPALHLGFTSTQRCERQNTSNWTFTSVSICLNTVNSQHRKIRKQRRLAAKRPEKKFRSFRLFSPSATPLSMACSKASSHTLPPPPFSFIMSASFRLCRHTPTSGSSPDLSLCPRIQNCVSVFMKSNQQGLMNVRFRHSPDLELMFAQPQRSSR